MDALPLGPPIAPMLARLARELPLGTFSYEPKWDGFRCIAFASAGAVDLRSRHQRPFARYFPELVAAFDALGRPAIVDGEIVIARGRERAGFEELLARLPPSETRVARLAREAPATFIAFDLLAVGAEDLRARPFAERRARLEALLARCPAAAVQATPATADPTLARAWLDAPSGSGVDGVVAKRPDLPYSPGRRVMVKVKREQTADCVVAGFRTFAQEPAVASLLLGLWDSAGALVHVGVSSSFPDAERLALFRMLRPLATPLPGHPWERGFNLSASPVGRLAGSAGRWDPLEMALDWCAIRPERVAEVAYDQLDRLRFRHPARFVRWRPDREPRSCALDQLSPHVPMRPLIGEDAAAWSFIGMRPAR